MICNYSILKELKGRMEQKKADRVMFICFDNGDNLLLLKKDKVFFKDEYKNVFYAENMTEISEIIKRHPV